MSKPTTSDGRKARVNLSIDAALVEEAKTLGINISEMTETALREKLKTLRYEAWLKANEATFAAKRADIEENGLWSDGLRLF